MKIAVRLYLGAAFALAGCASWKHDPAEGGSPKPRITLSDTNDDGVPDVARYRFIEFPDDDYELLDTDHDGFFDKKVTQGYSLQTQPLNPEIPVQQVELMAKANP